MIFPRYQSRTLCWLGLVLIASCGSPASSIQGPEWNPEWERAFGFGVNKQNYHKLEKNMATIEIWTDGWKGRPWSALDLYVSIELKPEYQMKKTSLTSCIIATLTNASGLGGVVRSTKFFPKLSRTGDMWNCIVEDVLNSDVLHEKQGAEVIPLGDYYLDVIITLEENKEFSFRKLKYSSAEMKIK